MLLFLFLLFLVLFLLLLNIKLGVYKTQARLINFYGFDIDVKWHLITRWTA
jgi:hypothetical protein